MYTQEPNDPEALTKHVSRAFQTLVETMVVLGYTGIDQTAKLFADFDPQPSDTPREFLEFVLGFVIDALWVSGATAEEIQAHVRKELELPSTRELVATKPEIHR